jgi:hypothetical protein
MKTKSRKFPLVLDWPGESGAWFQSAYTPAHEGEVWLKVSLRLKGDLALVSAEFTVNCDQPYVLSFTGDQEVHDFRAVSLQPGASLTITATSVVWDETNGPNEASYGDQITGLLWVECDHQHHFRMDVTGDHGGEAVLTLHDD